LKLFHNERLFHSNYIRSEEITSVSPNVGSVAGGTLITITGKYFYHSDTIPAQVTIAGKQRQD
jgi:hypothetical protein